MCKLEKSAWIADGAKVVGNVSIGQNSSVWFNAVVRADFAPINIGAYTNIQDNAVVHTNPNSNVQIGDYVTIGHGAIVHGCTVKNNVLIGMGAIVLDNAVIEENCIVGAGTLITQGKHIPSGSLVFGNPMKIVRQLSQKEIEDIKNNATHYANEAIRYRQQSQN